MPYFIMNMFGHYFVVESELDTNELDSCTCFDSLDALLEATAKNSGCSFDDLVGSEIRVIQHDNAWFESTHSGGLIPTDDASSIYDFLSNYEL